jgi:hypothetical protein
LFAARDDDGAADPVYSLLRPRDTIDPPDLFNTNKKESRAVGEVRGHAVGGRKTPKTGEGLRSNSWDNKENNKSYAIGDTQTLQRKPKSALSTTSHSRSKRMRNRSLEMVLDDRVTEGSPAKRYPMGLPLSI